MYRNYDPAVDEGALQMVSSFRGLTEIVNINHGGAGMVMDWQQQTGIMLVGGDSRIIKVWDAQTELPLFVSCFASAIRPTNARRKDLDTDSDSPVTSLVSRITPGFPLTLFAAGFANGEIKLFDRRDPDAPSVVRQYHDHESWVQNVRPHPTKPSQFLSARFVCVEIVESVC